MAIDLYARLDVLVNDVIQIEVQNATLDVNAGLEPVKTIQKGLAGFSETGGDSKFSGEWAIPKNGLEFDVITACDEKQNVKIEITAGAKSYIGTGKFMSAKLNQSTSGAAQCSAEWMGELKSLS